MTKPIDGRAKATAISEGRETITLRIDQDVLDFFQKDGRGWQDRINAALRQAAGKSND
nr:BrnA antitoxin family protein [Microvirga zambiensis]